MENDGKKERSFLNFRFCQLVEVFFSPTKFRKSFFIIFASLFCQFVIKLLKSFSRNLSFWKRLDIFENFTYKQELKSRKKSARKTAVLLLMGFISGSIRDNESPYQIEFQLLLYARSQVIFIVNTFPSQ